MSMLCKVVMYHYVRPLAQSHFSNIKGLEYQIFKKQLKFFKKNFNLITIEQFLDSIYDNYVLPKNSIILTFDDGFKDHFRYVFPALKKLEIPGIFFPPAKPISEKIVLDVHKIHHVLANCNNLNNLVNEILDYIRKNQKEFHLENPNTIYEKLAYPSKFDDKNTIFIKRVLQKELPEKLRSEITQKLFAKLVTSDETSFSEELYLSYDEIKEMCANKMIIGSHGYTHRWLSTLNNYELNYELKHSIDFLNKFSIDNKYWLFCYPYGDYDYRIIEQIKNLGFKAGFTTISGDAELSKEKIFELKRYDTNDFIS